MPNLQATSIPEKIAQLMADKNLFDSYVYTPWEKAVIELEQRRTNVKLQDYVSQMLPHGLPEAMDLEKSYITLFRHIATPNFEIARFLAIADFQPQFKSIILEYVEDKFNDRNDGKYFLGKLRFHKKIDKNGDPIVEHANIINFNESNNKPISSIQTHWGQNLVDFHHEMFEKQFTTFANNKSDVSEWLHLHGQTAKEYYKSFLTLFLKNGILFENLFINSKEQGFTETVILPAFFEIEKECGFKPLIVTLAPKYAEADNFWNSFPYSLKKSVDGKKQW